MKKYLLSSLVLVLLLACKKDENPVTCENNGTKLKVNVLGKFGNQDWVKDSVYRNFQNFPIKIEKVNFFITGMKFQSDTDTLKVDLPFLYRNNLDQNITSKEFALNTFGDFTEFKSNIGVADPENTADPTAYDNAHDFSINQASDMHWSWNSGYIFLKIEGKYDSVPNSNETPLNFSWHIGNAVNLDSIRVLSPFSLVSNQVNDLNFSFDLQKVFASGGDTVWINDKPFTHSAPADADLSKKIMNNFTNSIELQ